MYLAYKKFIQRNLTSPPFNNWSIFGFQQRKKNVLPWKVLTLLHFTALCGGGAGIYIVNTAFPVKSFTNHHRPHVLIDFQ